MSAVLSAPAVSMTPRGALRGALRAPASKSVTNRLLIMAALADGVSDLRSPLDSDDSRAMRNCVVALGAQVHDIDGGWRITGTAGAPRSPSDPLDVRLSGTTARFVTAVLTLSPAGGVVDGRGHLRRRPIAPLATALAALGADVRPTDGGLPVTVAGGGLDGGQVDVDVSGSSQFASALLMVAPYARGDVVCRTVGRAADDYIALTTALMTEWGAQVDRHAGGGWRVRGGAGYRARSLEVEYDASAAAHLLAMGVASGGVVTVTNAAADSRQPDAALPQVFADMGCDVRRDGQAVTVTAGAALRPVDVSLAAMPDQVTTMAVLAALAPGTSVLRDVAVARLHETDRLAALATELGKVGVRVDELPDALVIHGGTARGPAVLDTYDDHRLAMAFAALGTRVPDLVITDPGCVAKTYPEFWHDVARLGADWEERTS
jgi:3-phosphoshikimate 1-carboxyvinyltransferase